MKKIIQTGIFFLLLIGMYSLAKTMIQTGGVHSSLDALGIVPANEQVENAGDGYYAYSTLNEREQLIYNQIVSGVSSFEKKITLSMTEQKEVERAYDAVMSEHSELFWMEGYTFTIYEVAGQAVECVFEPRYSLTQKEAEEKKAGIDAYTAKFLSEAAFAQTDYDKTKFTYEYIINGTDYYLHAKDSQNICSVILYGESVCMGYARAMQYLLKQLGVVSIVVSGTADGETHAWNLIKMDEDFYYVDATWGEPNISGTNSDIGNHINYTYFGLTTEEMQRTYNVDSEIELPECTAKKDNYYVHEEKYIQLYDELQIEEMVRRDYEAQRFVELKCVDSQLYNQVFNYLIEGTAVSRITGCTSISYIEDRRNHILIVCFSN